MPVPSLSPSAITSSFVPRARPRCSKVELEGDVILVDDDSGAVHLLNPTAQIIWSCFDGSGTIAEIARDLCEVFAADLAAVTREVTDVARQLGEHGLLERVSRTIGGSASLPTGDGDPSQVDRRAGAVRQPRFSARPPST